MVKISRQFDFADRQGPADRYFIASGRAMQQGFTRRYYGWGSTPHKAKLNLLYQQGRRRHSVD